jgi:hypothetical protein
MSSLFLTKREASAQPIDFIATQQTLTATAQRRAIAVPPTSPSSEFS